MYPKLINLAKLNQKGGNDLIKVMSYNVSWEALEGAKSRKLNMEQCIIDNVNQCSNNIAKIIQQYGSDYDFIALQEIQDTPNQWQQLKSNIQENFLNDYQLEFTTAGRSGLLTLYNKNKYRLMDKFDGSLPTNPNDSRSYQVLVFSENIILINVHMSHNYESLVNSFKLLRLIINKIIKKYSRNNFRVIFCGDFNYNDPFMVPEFQKILKRMSTNFQPETTLSNREFLPRKTISFNETKLLTCCSNKTAVKYDKSYDHIFCNQPNSLISYQTLTDIDKFVLNGKIIMSDHLPVFALFR